MLLLLIPSCGACRNFTRSDRLRKFCLSTDPTLQTHGTARRLVRGGAHADNRQRRTSAWTIQQNEGAVRFYEQNGFPMSDRKNLAGEIWLRLNWYDTYNSNVPCRTTKEKPPQRRAALP